MMTFEPSFGSATLTDWRSDELPAFNCMINRVMRLQFLRVTLLPFSYIFTHLFWIALPPLFAKRLESFLSKGRLCFYALRPTSTHGRLSTNRACFFWIEFSPFLALGSVFFWIAHRTSLLGDADVLRGADVGTFIRQRTSCQRFLFGERSQGTAH